jgi:hypothetical protein
LRIFNLYLESFIDYLIPKTEKLTLFLRRKSASLYKERTKDYINYPQRGELAIWQEEDIKDFKLKSYFTINSSEFKKSFKILKRNIIYLFLFIFKYKKLLQSNKEFLYCKKFIDIGVDESCSKGSFVFSRGEKINVFSPVNQYHLLLYTPQYKKHNVFQYNTDLVYKTFCLSDDLILDQLSYYFNKPVFFSDKDDYKKFEKYLKLVCNFDTVTQQKLHTILSEKTNLTLINIYQLIISCARLWN